MGRREGGRRERASETQPDSHVVIMLVKVNVCYAWLSQEEEKSTSQLDIPHSLCLGESGRVNKDATFIVWSMLRERESVSCHCLEKLGCVSFSRSTQNKYHTLHLRISATRMILLGRQVDLLAKEKLVSLGFCVTSINLLSFK